MALLNSRHADMLIPSTTTTYSAVTMERISQNQAGTVGRYALQDDSVRPYRAFIEDAAPADFTIASQTCLRTYNALGEIEVDSVAATLTVTSAANHIQTLISGGRFMGVTINIEATDVDGTALGDDWDYSETHQRGWSGTARRYFQDANFIQSSTSGQYSVGDRVLIAGVADSPNVQFRGFATLTNADVNMLLRGEATNAETTFRGYGELNQKDYE